MKPINALAEKLEHLLHHGTFPASRLSRGDRSRLQSLFDAGVLQEERAGAGLRVLVREVKALQAFADKIYPSGLREVNLDLPSRARAVAALRDSKKGRGRCPATVLLRGFHGCIITSGGASLAVADWTSQAGVAALGLDRLELWAFSGVFAVVENLEVFWNIERISPEVGLALYAEGRLDQKALDWLSSYSMDGARVIHFGDYDPVGLDEYLRLKNARQGRSELYFPQNLEELFRRFSRSKLLTDSAAIMNRLRRCDDQEVRSVLGLIDRFGGGLEHESLLIDEFDN